MSRTWYYSLAAVSGAAVMVAELGAARMLTPVFGGSIGVWAIVIALTMVGLAAGYALGGRWADRAGGVVVARRAALLGAVSIGLLPVIDTPLLRATADLPVELGTFLAGAVLLLPCLIFLGQVAPALIRGLTQGDARHVGVTAGAVYAVSTLGSLIGTLLAGLWLLPYLPTHVTFPGTALIVLLPVLVSAYPLGAAGLALIVASIALSLPPSGAAGRAPAPHEPCALTHKRQSHFGELRVVDCLPDERLLLGNGIEQGTVSLFTGAPPYPYAEFFVAAARQHIDRPHRGLLIGLGPGVMVRPLQAMGQRLDLVEIDPQVVAIAQRYFGLRHPAIVDDGRRFLRGTDQRWDVIYLDAVLGGNPPWHLYTREAFAAYRARLEDGGAVVVNFVGNHGDPAQRPALAALLATARTAFPVVVAYTHPAYAPQSRVRNYVIVATDRPARPADRVEDYETRLVAQLAEEMEAVATGAGRVLRDDAAPLAALVAPTMKAARRVARRRLPIEVLID